MYDKEHFVLKIHLPPSLSEINEIGKTLGWTSKAFRAAAKSFTLERNASPGGRGLPHQHVTDDISWFTPTYKDTPEWQDATVVRFDAPG